MSSTKLKLRIYTDRLKGGDSEEISETLDPAFLEIPENDEIVFKDPVVIQGSAYIVDEFLVLSLHIQTKVELPCALCNTPFSLPIHITNFLHEEPVEAIKQGVFDYAETLREAILLEVPFYPQCGGSSCLNRKQVEKFLKKPTEEDEDAQERYHPFENL
jgi:uncharacterized metal-binding protein YceD (DUF177 family)